MAAADKDAWGDLVSAEAVVVDPEEDLPLVEGPRGERGELGGSANLRRLSMLVWAAGWCLLSYGASTRFPRFPRRRLPTPAAAHASPPALATRFPRRRLQPLRGRVVHMAGQSAGEFHGYSSVLPNTTRPAALTQYFRLEELLADDQKAERYFTAIRQELDTLGDRAHVVLPHISVSLRREVDGHIDGTSVPSDIIAGKFDAALKQFADAVPLLGRPLFLRIGSEFNGHWNNYSAPEYVLAWRRIEAALAVNRTTRDAVALVWDMTCDAVAPSDACTAAAECWDKYWPGDDVVDWTGVNVFQAGRGRNFSSMPNSTCVLGFADEAARRGWPVLIAESLPRFHPTSAGASSWDAWFEPFFRDLLPHPGVQGWSYIDRDCRTNSTTWTTCVGGLWGDARIEAPAASYVRERYKQAIANASRFVHGDTLAATCAALGVSSCDSEGQAVSN